MIEVGPDGQMRTDLNWYLFLYNLWKNVLQGSSGSVATPNAVLIPMEDIDVNASDVTQAYRGIANSMAMQLDQEVGPSLRDLANALTIAQGDLPDPVPVAQPGVVLVVGASPFTYTAPANGTLCVVGGSISDISYIRQGTTLNTGAGNGPIPMSRTDQVKITYSSVPVLNFLPT
jgi:hypothetical protein